MRVTALTLRHFRNYESLSLSFDANIIVFTGHNAQGKTNLLEAIYLAAIGRSHRTAVETEMIQWDKDQSGTEIHFERGLIEHHIAIRLDRNSAKQVMLNDHAIKPKDLLGNLNVVLFSPEDLALVKGSPALRRRFLDMEISQTSKAYYQDLLSYNRIVQQRNNLLKKIKERRAGSEQLASWDEQLARGAAALVKRRKDALRKMAMLANLMHRKLTNSLETLTTRYYQPYFDEKADTEDDTIDSSWYLKKIQLSRPVDMARSITTIGPHRDDLLLSVNGISLRNFGSQGQQRTGALAFKLAELEYIKSETGEYPVLLLDDVMSELDLLRRSQLTAFVKDRIQTFITATDRHLFDQPKFASFYHIKEGRIEE